MGIHLYDKWLTTQTSGNGRVTISDIPGSVTGLNGGASTYITSMKSVTNGVNDTLLDISGRGAGYGTSIFGVVHVRDNSDGAVATYEVWALAEAANEGGDAGAISVTKKLGVGTVSDGEWSINFPSSTRLNLTYEAAGDLQHVIGSWVVVEN